MKANKNLHTYLFLFILIIFPVFLLANDQEPDQLKNDLQIVWPLLQTIKVEYDLTNAQLEFIESDEERTEFLKEYEEFVKEKYFKTLLSLKYRQVKLLVLLIDREFGENAFTLLRKYRTFSRALYWYRAGKVVGIDIREKYKPENYPEIEKELLRIKSAPPACIDQLAAP
jgi:hypothetical protein